MDVCKTSISAAGSSSTPNRITAVVISAAATGTEDIPGQSDNRHCAGSLTAIGNAAAQIGSGMERALIAGGVQSLSMTPLVNWRIPGPEVKVEERWMPPTHPETPDAPCKDMSITVGWNTARAVGITREEMDAWAARSHQCSSSTARWPTSASTNTPVATPRSKSSPD